MSIRESIVVLGLVAACGSGTSYIYAPEGADITAGSVSTEFQIPPEEPRGEVRVQSGGITEINSDGQKIPMMHLRLSVANNSDQNPWTVDTREQLLDIPGRGRATPRFVNTDRDRGPLLQVPRLDQRVIDLYYPLPPGVTDPDDLDGFDLVWQVRTGPRLVAQRTSFGRVNIEPEVYPSLYAGWGSYWWYDPFYPSYGYIYTQPYIRSPNHIIVTRPGRGTYHRL
ncbi:MAG: uncharacterized protein JWP01_205 [Myxococcales bacterium]|nr:uncharacterized protein [Myxococcales bacterium]